MPPSTLPQRTARKRTNANAKTRKQKKKTNARVKPSAAKKVRGIDSRWSLGGPELYVASSGDETEKTEDIWDPDEDWEIDMIVDEECSLSGRRRYKISWKGWKRASDGTSTTWVDCDSIQESCPEAVARWQSVRKAQIIARREEYSRHGIPMSLLLNPCISRMNTTLEEIGRGHDQALTPDMIFPGTRNAPVGADWSLIAKKNGDRHWAASAVEWDGIAMEGGVADQEMDFDEETLRNSINPDDRSVRHNAGPAATYETPSGSVSESPTRFETDISLDDPAEQLDARRLLQAKWDNATKLADAARVVIVNELDDELIPPSVDPDVFEYLERGPYLHDGSLVSHSQFLAGCGSRNNEPYCLADQYDHGCTDPRFCDCQKDVPEIVINKRRTIAYDDTGKYQLPDNTRVVVTECNEHCLCTIDNCQNRVAQRARDVELEVYKVGWRGWSVRLRDPVPKGKVIGVFTGELVLADATLAGENDEWTYQLDGMGSDQHMWNVTSRNVGNWSRFLNHSCFPSLRVYPVQYDSLLEQGSKDVRHRLAFVALRELDVGAELTINYRPQEDGLAKSCSCVYGGCKTR